MRVLAFETSCDETSAAVIADGRVLSNAIASQIRLHAEYGGVVPELAAREHLKNLPKVAQTALHQSGLEVGDIEGVAATVGPGLPQALLVGARAAQAFAFAGSRPFVGVHHHEAHLYSPWIEGEPPEAAFHRFEPNVSLIVSGGHTVLVHVEGVLRHRVLGATMDDAAGECFDKVGKLLGLPYPGGPVMDRLAAEGRADAYGFPRPLLRDSGDDFSFSGLKTSVRYFLDRHPGLASDPVQLRDLCASVQAAIVDVLIAKLLGAARRLRVGCVTASGGVSCNREFRSRLMAEAASAGVKARFAEPALCTDNAAMIGVLGERRLLAGDRSGYDDDIRPHWPLEALAAAPAAC